LQTLKKSFHGAPELYCKKPFGYSWFPMELMPCPVSWAESTGNMVWYKRHTEVSHNSNTDDVPRPQWQHLCVNVRR